MERSIPLNLDLTCMKVETKLEDSLAIASTALNLVKSVEPSIITIQCLITEESLDYLLFKKLPGNNFCKKFTKSTDIKRQPNSCVAWKVENLNFAAVDIKIPQTSLYRATLVDLSPIAQLFPQTNVDSSTMVHLWPKVNPSSFFLLRCPERWRSQLSPGPVFTITSTTRRELSSLRPFSSSLAHSDSSTISR